MKPKIKPGFFLQLRSGEAFYPADGTITSIQIQDIAHSLSHICRYNGHCRNFYSVAEHSVMVSRIIRQRWPDDLNAIWAGLLHDATEAYVGDVTTPLKVTMPQFMELEHKIELEVAKKFGIKWDKQTVERVKTADMVALSTEARGLFKDVSHWSAIASYAPEPKLLAPGFPLDSASARRRFMSEYWKISKELSK